MINFKTSDSKRNYIKNHTFTARMKNTVKYILHKLLGFKNYLFIFSLYKILTLRKDKNEKDFFAFLHLIPANRIIQSLIRLGNMKSSGFRIPNPFSNCYSAYLQLCRFLKNYVHRVNVKDSFPSPFFVNRIFSITIAISGIKFGLSMTKNNFLKNLL